MATILVATLGESPIVVTAMARALTEHPDGPRITLDEVVVIHPEGAVDPGVDLIRETLDRHGCTLVSRTSGSGDVDSYVANIEFLRTLDSVLAEHQTDTVYVSCTGGRKSMAALAAAITQFHSHVRGIYYLLDRDEHDPLRRHFFTLDDLYTMSPDERLRCMEPPLGSLILVPLPFRTLANASSLRRFYQDAYGDDHTSPIDTDGLATQFFSQVFGAAPIEPRLELLFSQAAVQQFRELDRRDATKARDFWDYFEEMRKPAWLLGHQHGSFSGRGRSYHFCKRRQTKERPFFFTEPNPIELYPGKPIERVIVTGLSVEQDNGQYDPSGEDWLREEASPPWQHLGDLRALPGVLVAPIGESPMVATQTYTLLDQRERVNVSAVVLVYPGANNAISAQADRLKDLFSHERYADLRGGHTPTVLLCPIPGLADLASAADCDRYAAALSSELATLPTRFPEHPIYLSISGGRKAMAALAYYAAQQAGLCSIWHTVIADEAIEQRVLSQTTPEALEHLDRRTIAERFFLHAYTDADAAFRLFEVPVVPVR